MADYIAVCTKDVHIPQCGDPRCREHLKKIATQLKKHGCQCVEEYQMHGLWKKWFLENFLDCCYTLLHKCPLLFTQISHIFSTEFTPEYWNKVVCIQLVHGSTKGKQVKDKAFEDFFKEFHVQAIVDDASIIDFVQRFMKLLDKSPRSPTADMPLAGADGYIRNSDDERRICHQIRQLTHDRQHEESVHRIEVYPNELGQSSGREVYASSAFPEDLRGKLRDMSRYTDLKQHINHIRNSPDTVLGNFIFVLHKILPKLYDIRDSIGLANIVSCNQPVLQKLALTYSELLVLNGSTANDTGKMQETVILLTNSVCEMSMKYKTTPPGQICLAMIKKRMINLILMIHCQIITQRQEESDSDGLFHNAISKIMSETAAHGCGSINKVIKIIKSLKGVHTKAEYFRECSASHAKDLVRENVATQIVVIFDCLLKIFSRLDAQVLHLVTFLKKYLTARRFFRVPKVCCRMIFRGVALFFKHLLKQAVHLEIGCVCSEVMNVITRASVSESADEVNSTLHSLLFDKVPAVRHCVIDFFKRRNLYSDTKLPHLLLHEIVSMLCPLFVIDPKEKLQRDEAQWWTVLGTFGHQKAIVCFHKPSERDHWEKDSMRFIHPSDMMHLNEIKKLGNLKHPGIISLLAYQRTSLPLFYILEDYTTKNLQMTLKNRNDNRGFFNLSVLIKFLADIAEAVDFCHKKDIVHINLTAASVFIVGNQEQVKLGAFQLSVSLGGHAEKVVDSVVARVPTRWTAPESHRRHTFSKESDIWMVGHLIYEVLTHGVLPYSHLDLTDEELVQQFFLCISCSLPVQLFHEPCLKMDHYDLILHCTRLEASERPNISAVLAKLKGFHRQSTDCRPQYPSLSDGKRRPSTSMGQGIPDVFGKPAPQTLEFIMEVTSMLTQYKLKEAFIFREILEGHISEALLSCINDGSLDSIIPWVQHTMSTANSGVSFIDCYIPASCGFCILDQTTERKLGASLHDYLKVILHIAKFLKILHDKGIVLGHMCASTFFLEQHCQKIKIYVASLGHACESSCYRRPPTDKDITRRAAPEVKGSGLYSTASDVFCFGHLIREIITAFDATLTGECPEYFNDGNIYGTLTHGACRQQLKQLINICCTIEVIRRPTIEGIIDEIMRLLADLNSEYSSMPSHVTVGSRDFNRACPRLQWEDSRSETVPKQICQSDTDTLNLYEDPDKYRSPGYIVNSSQSMGNVTASADDPASHSQSNENINSMLDISDNGENNMATEHMAIDSLTFLKQAISCVNVNLLDQPENSQVLQDKQTNYCDSFSADSLTLVKRATFNINSRSDIVPEQMCQSDTDRLSVFEDPDKYRSLGYIVNSNQSTEDVAASVGDPASHSQSNEYINSMLDISDNGKNNTMYRATHSTQHMAIDSLTFLKPAKSCVNVNLLDHPENLQVLQDKPRSDCDSFSADSLTLVKKATPDINTGDVDTTDQQNTSHIYDKLSPPNDNYSAFIYADLIKRNVDQVPIEVIYV